MKSRAVCRGVAEWLLLGRSVVAEFSSAHFARRNVHRPGEEFTGWKSNPVKEKIASRKDDRDAHNTLRQGRLSLLRQARGGGENESEDPRVTPTRGAPKFMFRTYVWATRLLTELSARHAVVQNIEATKSAVPVGSVRFEVAVHWDER